MAKDKMKIKLKEWIETQESRLDNKMRVHHVRVHIGGGGGQYYADVKVTSEEIIIKPDDVENPAIVFYDCHLNGFNEIGSNAIKLNQRFGRPSYKLYFRTPNQMQRVLRRVKMVMGTPGTL